MTRHAGPARIKIASPEDRVNETFGRKALGEAVNRASLGGVAVQTVRSVLPDGTVIEANVHGSQKSATVGKAKKKKPVPKEKVDDLTRAYVGSTGGLRIYDLATKRLVKTMTGLEQFEVDDVNKAGSVVYMTGTLAVRVDVSANSAFGYSYVIDALDVGPVIVPDQYAHVIGGRLSPDETLFLAAFDTSYIPIVGTLIDGLGGFVLADATTLAPVRDEYRMTYRPQCAAWAADSQSFFMSTSMNTDPGGVPSTTVADSQYDYISKFDRDGVLLGSRLMADWGFSPGTGYQRRVKAICADHKSTRIYAMVFDMDALNRIYAIDTTDDTLPIVASILVDTVGSDTVRVMAVNADNTRLIVLDNNEKVLEFDIVDDAMTLIHSTPGDYFNGAIFSGINGFGCQDIRNTPASQRKTKMFYDTLDDTLRAYTTFDKPPVYTFPLATAGLKNRYALAHIGKRISTEDIP